MEISPTLESFREVVLRDNPFDANRVTPVTDVWADAEDVYREPFDRLRHLCERAHRDRTGLGVMLTGDPGVGKSHLLARLQRQASTDAAPMLVLTLANLQAEPQRIPRALLRGVLDLLSVGWTRQPGAMPLVRVMNGMARYAIRKAIPPRETATEQGTLKLIDDLCRELPSRAAVLDRSLFQVLYRFFKSARRRIDTGDNDGIAHAALRYLRGEAIDDEDAKRLGLSASLDDNHAVALADDEQVKKVFVALAQAARFWGRPIVLALDQVDNLEIEQFRALGRFLHALLDAATNLVVVTCGVRSTLLKWKDDRILQESSWDRVAQEEIALTRLSPTQCPPILVARLEPFIRPFVNLPEVRTRVEKDTLFPLGEAWLRERIEAKLDIRPRDLINWARAGWTQRQNALREKGVDTWLQEWREEAIEVDDDATSKSVDISDLLDVAVANRLETLRQQKKSELEAREWNPEAIADLLHELAKFWIKREGWPYLQSVTRVNVAPQQKPTQHLLFHQRMSATGPDLTLGVACALPPGNSLTGQLRRLASDQTNSDRLLVLYDARDGFQLATKGREYWEKIEAKWKDDVRQMGVEINEHACLAALLSLLKEAGVDLEFVLPDGEARPISRAEAFDSLLRQELFPGSALLGFILRMDPVAQEGAVGAFAS